MPKTYNAVWIHAVWATKYRQPLINEAVEADLHDIMRREFDNSGCKVSIINGMPDHVHCLFLLKTTKSLAEIIKHVKGVSAHHINQQLLSTEKFTWQRGYSVFSVSKSGLKPVFQYIQNQKKHHQSKTLAQELDSLEE